MQGFLLGLANGTTCLFTCAPALVPYLLSEGKNARQNMLIVSQFLTGRLIGYLIFAILAYCVSSTLSLTSLHREILFGAAYTLLSIVLFLYVKTPKIACAAHSLRSLPQWLTEKYPFAIPLIMGFLTGVNLCPPFLLVFTEAAGIQNLWQNTALFFNLLFRYFPLLFTHTFFGIL